MTCRFYGIGALTRTQVVSHKPLDVVADKRPKGHANIVGWPPKPKLMDYAKKVAADASLQLRP